MRVEEFRLDDLDQLENVGGQEYLVSLTDREKFAFGLKGGNHYSLFSDDMLVACIGFAPVHEWRCTAWALLKGGEPKLFAAVHIVSRRLLRSQPWRRVEAYVDPTFGPAVRWMQLLGFQIETPYKPYYCPDGRGASEWVFYTGSG